MGGTGDRRLLTLATLASCLVAVSGTGAAKTRLEVWVNSWPSKPLADAFKLFEKEAGVTDIYSKLLLRMAAGSSWYGRAGGDAADTRNVAQATLEMCRCQAIPPPMKTASELYPSSRPTPPSK